MLGPSVCRHTILRLVTAEGMLKARWIALYVVKAPVYLVLPVGSYIVSLFFFFFLMVYLLETGSVFNAATSSNVKDRTASSLLEV